MQRTLSTIAVLAGLLLAASIAAPGVVAQNDLTSDHPLVGAWVMDDGGVALIHADGTYSAADSAGGVAFGVWTPTGPREAAITFTFPATAEAGVPGVHATARANARLSGGGAAIDVVATIELPTSDGGTTGQLGPIESHGTRLIAEPPDEPVAPFSPGQLSE